MLGPLAVVAIGLAGSNARADNAPSEAQSLFDRGRELRLRGDCVEAMPFFRGAYQIYPNGLGSLRNIAECEEANGHFAASRSAWLELGRTLTEHTEPRYAGWAGDAAQAAARLTPKLGTLTIEVRMEGSGGAIAQDASGAPSAAGGDTPAPDVEVSINGERLSSSLVGTPILRDPGHYVIRAVSRAGEAMREESVDLAPGQKREVDLVLRLMPPEPVEAQSRASSSSGGSGPDAAMWTAFALGTASLIGAGIAEAERQSALSDRGSTLAACPASSGMAGGACSPQNVQSINDRGNAAATWENVFFIAGGVGLTTGVVLLAVGHAGSPARSGPSGARDPSTRRAALVVSPAGVSLAGGF